MNQLHGRRDLAQLRREVVRIDGIVQDKNVEALRQEVQRDRLRLPLAAKAISAAGADQQARVRFVVPAHLGQVVRQIGCQRRVAAILAKCRKKVLQMQNFISHL